MVIVSGVCFATSTVAEQAPSSNWTTRCDTPAGDQASVCEIQHTILLKQTGQELLKVTVKVEPNAVMPALMIRTPLGLFLPDGVQFRIDGGSSVQLPLQTCAADGCYAGSSISQDLLADLMSGQGLTVTFSSLEKKEMAVPMPLTGFATAYREIRYGPDPG